MDQYIANAFCTFELGLNFGKTLADTQMGMFRLPLNNKKSGPCELSLSFSHNRVHSPTLVETAVIGSDGEIVTSDALGYGYQVRYIDNNPEAVRDEVKRLNNILVDPAYQVLSNNQHDLVKIITEYFPDEMASFKKINLNDANVSSHLKKNYNKRYNRKKHKFAQSLAEEYLQEKWPAS
jgi:hypothetical protein